MRNFLIFCFVFSSQRIFFQGYLKYGGEEVEEEGEKEKQFSVYYKKKNCLEFENEPGAISCI